MNNYQTYESNIPAYPGPTGRTSRTGHSLLGISSFALSVIAALGTLAVFIVAGIIENNSPGGMDEESTVALVVGLSIFAVIFIEIIAFCLGIGGIVQSSKSRVFAIIGMVLSGIVMLLTIGLIILGLAIG